MPTTKPRLALVKWLDSRRPKPEWRRLDSFKPDDMCECVSVGFIIFEDELQIALAPNMADINDDNMQTSGWIHIPKCSITEIVGLEEKP